jgi:acyl-CoA dehydrogenase
MSDNRDLLVQTAERLFSDLNQNATPPEEACRQVSDAGFPSLLVPEADGGFAGDWRDACAVLRLAGYHDLQAPLADTLIATATTGTACLLGALTRAALISGALDRTLQMSVDYANARIQFGKPIAKFQVIQHALACFAEEAAAVNCAVQAAATATDAGNGEFEIASAKLRANAAASIAHATAHQVHGAIGFTREYPLHRWTRRLLTWSCEFGTERHWSEFLGRLVAARGAQNLWIDLTLRSDRTASNRTPG